MSHGMNESPITGRLSTTFAYDEERKLGNRLQIAQRAFQQVAELRQIAQIIDPTFKVYWTTVPETYRTSDDKVKTRQRTTFWLLRKNEGRWEQLGFMLLDLYGNLVHFKVDSTILL